jgi:signal transduction histidine kinase
MRRLALLTAAAVVAIIVESTSYHEGDNAALVIADGVVGFVFLASAVIAWQRRPQSRLGPIMCLGGLTWFAGSIWSSLVFLHRGPLVHLHLSYPTGRLRWRPAAATVAVAYTTAVVEPLGRNDAVTVALASGVAIVATGAYLRTSGAARRAGVAALLAAWGFAAVLALGAINRLANWQADRQVLWAYDIVVAAAVLVLLVDLLRGRWADAVVTDLVIDLGDHSGVGTLGDVLGQALGDRSLVLGYWLPEEHRYVDDTGRTVDPTGPPPGRVVTPISHRGAPLAVLVHDAAVLDDPALVDAVTAAARLAVSNVRLQAEAHVRVNELAASRRRIVEAADAQRQHLERDLQDRVQRRLARVTGQLAELRERTDADLLDELDRELFETRNELNEFARGLHPHALTEGGLTAAITALPSPLGRSIDVAIATGPLPGPVEAVIYFVCSEALTNIAKHADATSARIDITAHNGHVTATIDDDGVGGAEPQHGSGLRGLADRVEAIGGTLTVADRPEGGTRVEATIRTR